MGEDTSVNRIIIFSNRLFIAKTVFSILEKSRQYHIILGNYSMLRTLLATIAFVLLCNTTHASENSGEWKKPTPSYYKTAFILPLRTNVTFFYDENMTQICTFYSTARTHGCDSIPKIEEIAERCYLSINSPIQEAPQGTIGTITIKKKNNDGTIERTTYTAR